MYPSSSPSPHDSGPVNAMLETFWALVSVRCPTTHWNELLDIFACIGCRHAVYGVFPDSLSAHSVVGGGRGTEWDGTAGKLRWPRDISAQCGWHCTCSYRFPSLPSDFKFLGVLGDYWHMLFEIQSCRFRALILPFVSNMISFVFMEDLEVHPHVQVDT